MQQQLLLQPFFRKIGNKKNIGLVRTFWGTLYVLIPQSASRHPSNTPLYVFYISMLLKQQLKCQAIKLFYNSYMYTYVLSCFWYVGYRYRPAVLCFPFVNIMFGSQLGEGSENWTLKTVQLKKLRKCQLTYTANWLSRSIYDSKFGVLSVRSITYYQGGIFRTNWRSLFGSRIQLRYYVLICLYSTILLDPSTRSWYVWNDLWDN